MNWIKAKFWNISDVFEEYPKVFRRAIFYLVLAGLMACFYTYLLNAVVSFNIMGTYPFYSLITDNIDVLQWGIIGIPVVILLWGWCDAEGLYYQLKNRKYGY